MNARMENFLVIFVCLAIALISMPNFVEARDVASIKKELTKIERKFEAKRSDLKSRYEREIERIPENRQIERDEKSWQLQKEMEALDKAEIEAKKQVLNSITVFLLRPYFEEIKADYARIWHEYGEKKISIIGTAERQEKMLKDMGREKDIEQLKKDTEKVLNELEEAKLEELLKLQYEKDQMDQYKGDPKAQQKVKAYLKERDEIQRQKEKELGEIDEYPKAIRRDKEREWDNRLRDAWLKFQGWLKKHLEAKQKQDRKLQDKKTTALPSRTIESLKPEEAALTETIGYGAFVEGFLGAGFASSGALNPRLGTCMFSHTIRMSLSYDPAFVGGVRAGLWFERGGLLGSSVPEWLRYFGFYTDFSFQRQNFHQESVAGPAPGFTTTYSSEGTAAIWAFKFAARYPFGQSPDFPGGRWWVYAGVGPGIYFASQNPTFRISWAGLPPLESIKPDSSSSATVCLSVDAGVQFMATRNVFLDLWFNYTYARPCFSYQYRDPHNGLCYGFDLNPAINNWGVRVGAGWKF